MLDMVADTLFDNFASPPKAYSPVPIWWWSGEKIERSRLRWQLERFAEGGVYNLIVLNLAPTSPLYGSDPDDPPFLSEEWWELFLGMCEDARELGVSIWFYDQIGFSGANFQGQVVRENSRFAGQWLDSVVYEGDEPAELICPPEGTPLAAAVTQLGDDDEPVGAPQPLEIRNGRVTAPGGQRRRVRLVYAVHRGFDYFSVEGCARLLDMVHGEFERRAAHLFGDVIVGSFQDELPSLASWGEGFAEAFRAQMGYDLLPRLVELWDGRGDDADRLRCDFHSVRATLAEEAFFKPLFNWHERHHLLCGFDQQGPARAGHPIAAVGYYADYLRTHRWFTAPGSDHHGEAKIHSSLAHLYDRPRVWIESFHSSGWGGTLEETFDWLLPWLRAGATLYDPHAVYYSTRGGWWEWAPPSTCWRQPYWRHYAHFANAVSRLCYMLSQGHHVCDIGVLFPTTTIQAGLLADPKGIVLPDAQAAHDAYEKLVGSMFWQNMQPGVLDRDRRDYDVLDDSSLQRGAVEHGALVIGAERYRVLIVLGGSVLEAATAEKLVEFVDGGGQLIAVGALPRLAVGSEGDAVRRLRQLFADGRAQHLEDVEALSAALAELPRVVDAPTPTLHRRIDGRDVLFVPAAAPYATRQERNRSWLDVAYTFDPGGYQRGMRVAVRGVHGAPEFWDAFDGTRRTLPTEETADGVIVEIPFDTGPAALLVWPEQETAAAVQSSSSGEASVVGELSGEWSITLEPTIDNRYGDLARPAHPGAPPVQTWRFQHRIEATGQDGLAEGWQSGAWSDAQEVTATFGPQGWWTGPLPAEDAPAPLPPPIAEGGALQTDGWQPVVYSSSRGVLRDPIHLPTLGPKGHVPEEFLVFGRVLTGQTVQFRTGVWMEDAAALTLALGAPAAKQLWINGVEVVGATPGYLWLAPVRLKAGLNIIEFRLTAEQNLNLRASWALVRAPERYARPEWMTTPDEPALHSRITFFCDIDMPFTPAHATLQVGADAPCRVSVNGVEIGRQGGFDPYHSPARVQPYPVSNFRQGRNRIELETQDVGRKAAVLADGVAVSVDGQRFTWSSGPGWQVSRDGAPAVPVPLRRRQWADMMYDFVNSIFVDMDPAFSHLWRRPHPLPQAAWLEDKPADETVVAVEADPFGGSTRVEWLCWKVPPGAQKMDIPIAGRARIWIDGVEHDISGQSVVYLGDAPTSARTAVMRVEPARGCSGGRLLRGPVSYQTGEGRMRLGLWANHGLENYSGGLRYRTHIQLDSPLQGRLWLELGRVRGTAEVWVNGRSAGVRVLSPYRFDVTALLQGGENQVEVLVLNTLAPYLNTQSPTFYIFPGQCDSGLIGPVALLQQ